ncbi:MAG: (2Fe-2S)-binding protein [bacterium]
MAVKKRTGSRARRRGAAPVVVCRCEEVAEEEIRQAIRDGNDTIEAVKRALRTGMGHCQGRGCLRAIARMIEAETGRPAADQQWPRSRPPLKPLPLGMLGAAESDEPDR